MPRESEKCETQKDPEPAYIGRSSVRRGADRRGRYGTVCTDAVRSDVV